MALTIQEYRDLLVKMSREGGFPSYKMTDNGPQCLYRSTDGKQCAAGPLMPNEKYRPQFDDGVDCTCSSIESKFPNTFDIPEGMNINDVYEVQKCHDGLVTQSKVVPDWNHKLFVYRIDQIFSKLGANCGTH